MLGRGDYFGEQALLKSELRTANVVAVQGKGKDGSEGAVECLVLDRESFFQLIGDLEELKQKEYGDQKPKDGKGKPKIDDKQQVSKGNVSCAMLHCILP